MSTKLSTLLSGCYENIQDQLDSKANLDDRGTFTLSANSGERTTCYWERVGRIVTLYGNFPPVDTVEYVDGLPFVPRSPVHFFIHSFASICLLQLNQNNRLSSALNFVSRSTSVELNYNPGQFECYNVPFICTYVY